MTLEDAIDDFREAVLLKHPVTIKGERLNRIRELYELQPEPGKSWTKWSSERLAGEHITPRSLEELMMFHRNPKTLADKRAKDRKGGKPRQPSGCVQDTPEYLEQALQRAVQFIGGYAKGMSKARRRVYYDVLASRLQRAAGKDPSHSNEGAN